MYEIIKNSWLKYKVITLFGFGVFIILAILIIYKRNIIFTKFYVKITKNLLEKR